MGSGEISGDDVGVFFTDGGDDRDGAWNWRVVDQRGGVELFLCGAFYFVGDFFRRDFKPADS